MSSCTNYNGLAVGLTGGIASGKSTVASMFARLGATIIEADAVVRELLDQPDISKQIVAYFGLTTITDDSQRLNRAKLRDMIFRNDQQRIWLEQLLHPLVYAEIETRLSEVATPYCVIVVPLLLESAIRPKYDRILVIDAPETLQIQRAQQRDHITLEQVTAILRVQLTRAQRVTQADDIIYNDQAISHLYQQVLRLHQQYTQFSAQLKSY